MESSNLNIAKDIATIASPYVSAVVDTWLKPKLQKFFQRQDTDRKVFESNLYDGFREYLTQAFEKYSYVNVLVFPNQQIRLSEIYVPLTVGRSTGTERSFILIDEYKDDFLPQYRKVLITDFAGVGKSTLLKALFLSAIEKNVGIPVFIELRSLSNEKTVLKHILNELSAIDAAADEDLVLELIRNGDFIFFFDGYDEISLAERRRVTDDLHDFIAKAKENLFVITSRPELSLTAFPDFLLFHIQPLTKAEAFGLLSRYDSAGHISKNLIERLESKSDENLNEFLSNPLLVSLLYKSFEYKPTIPFKKHLFYRQVYDALYETHDLTKDGTFVRDKYSGLDIDDFHRVLRALGYLTFKAGRIEFGKDELLVIISDAKTYSAGLNFKQDQFLKDLLITVPLFVQDGPFYSWAHKSLQDYFAAQYIFLDAKDHRTLILTTIARSKNLSKYTNILDLYYDIDNKTFRHTLIRELITDFIEHYDSSYLNLDQRNFSSNEIHKRRVASYGYQFVVFPGWFFGAGQGIGEGIVRKASAQLLSQKNEGSGTWDESDRGEIRVSETFAQRVIVLIIPNPLRPMLQFLTTKQEPFVKVEPDVDHHLILRTRNLAFDAPFVLDDDPRNDANSPMLFDNVSELLLAIGVREILDIDKCRELRRDIEAEIERDSDVESLISGL